MNQSFRITPVYDLLLRGSEKIPVGLYHLQMATALQLCNLHYSAGSVKMVKARLKTLVDNGYAQSDGIPTKFFRSPYYYTLGTKAVRYLEDCGFMTDEPFRADRETNKHSLFVEHTLELNDILVSASLLSRTYANYRLHSFVHERTLKRKPYKTVWQGSNYTLVPDAFLDFRIQFPDGHIERRPRLLEHDRGTEQQRNFRRKVRAYISLLKEERTPVAFTTFAGEARIAQMREWAYQELTATNELKAFGMAFRFTAVTRPLDARQLWLMPQWYTPYTDDKPITVLSD